MSDEKTEKPSEARKREARRKGQVVKSQELVSAVTLLAAFGTLVGLLPQLVSRTTRMMAESLAGVDGEALIQAQELLGNLFSIGGGILLWVLLASAFSGLLINLVTSGFIFAPESLKPDWNRLNPKSKLQSWFSRRTLFEGIKHVLKAWVMLYLVWKFWETQQDEFLGVTRVGIEQHGSLMESVKGLAWKLAGAQMLFGLADFGIQYYENQRQMKMSKKELKDEHKQQEGDPMVKAQRRAQARKLIRSAGMNRLKEARVVVTNPTHYAVALKYEVGMGAPEVVSKGTDLVAAKIKEKAIELGIPLVENRPLARALHKVELNATIPAALFEAVAELLLSVSKAEEFL